MVDNFDEFYEDFYQSQFDWYDSKAINNKQYHRIMKVAQIVLASFLPVAITLFPVTSSIFWSNAIIIASVALIILEALESYLNYQKKWMNYRTTAEGLRREKHMFKTRTDEYDGVDDPERVFVERVMALTSQENRYWEITTRKSQES